MNKRQIRKSSTLTVFIVTVLIATITLPVLTAIAAPPSPTVSIVIPAPGTAAAPTAVSLRPVSNDFKVKIQVYDDLPITVNSVQVGYYSGATPDTGAFTFATAALNANYNCGTGCGIYEVNLSLVPGNYYLYARASSADGMGRVTSEPDRE